MPDLPGTVNFEKIRQVAGIISDLGLYPPKFKHSLPLNGPLFELLLQIQEIDEDALYEMSLSVLPLASQPVADDPIVILETPPSQDPLPSDSGSSSV